MTEISRTDQQIMQLKPGQELDQLVESVISEYVTIDYGCCSNPNQTTQWSRKENEALDLWRIIDEHITAVGIMRSSIESPNIISQLATVGEEDDAVFVYTSSWAESLCKAVVLYEQGYRGDYLHPEWVKAQKDAPKRVIQ
jgi:hypothetical protein